MYIKKYSYWTGILVLLLLTSCVEEYVGQKMIVGNEMVFVKTSLSNLNTDGSSLKGEDDIKNMQACVFENGVLSEVYTDLVENEAGYYIKLHASSGRLYMLANAADILDLRTLKNQGITEDEWLDMTVFADRGVVTPFATGAIALGEQTGSSLKMNLQRGVVRFDLLLKSDKVAVKKIIFKNVDLQTYLFQKEPIASPEKAVKQDMEINFSPSLQQDSLGVMYVYEQVNSDLKVEVELVIGDRTFVQEVDLPDVLKRNTIYTLTIRKDLASSEIKVDVAEWENGGASNLYPDWDSKILVDRIYSEFPSGVTVMPEGDKIIFPYTSIDAILAVDCNDELECLSDSSIPLIIEPINHPNSINRNLFRIVKEKWRIGVPMQNVKLQFRRKGLKEIYPEDCLTITLQENPTKLEGMLQFQNSDVCDFERYIDNELGVFVLPVSKELSIEYEAGEDEWIKLLPQGGNPNRIRVIAGWKPNDTTANGRRQEAKLIISNKIDGSGREEYTVVRRNWGLPVTYFNGVWWCKYNAKGNVKDFNDQVLSSDDPAVKVGKTLFDYLQTCTPEEFFELWKWEYQGDSGLGLQVIDDNGVAKLDGYDHNTSIHMNKLDPRLLAPDGYEIPSMEEYNRIFSSISGTIWLMWDGSHKTSWNGDTTIQRRQRRRNDVKIGTVELNDLIYISMYNNDHIDYEPIVWYGASAQWNNDGIYHGHYNNMLFTVYSPKGEGWYFTGSMRGLYSVVNGAGTKDTRIIRFKKSDVEYIYE